MELLIHLARHREQLVSREALIASSASCAPRWLTIRPIRAFWRP
jgi:hypothetical protein